MNIRKAGLSFLLIFSTLFFNTAAKAWGPDGHAIVANLALSFVKDDVRKNVLAVLGDMPVDTAANWMDIIKSNPDYDFMRTWHYVDFPKGSSYQPSDQYNIINRLINSYNELSHKKLFCDEQVKFDLLVLLHLMGDLHMPLHTAYDDDLGGNKVTVQYDSIKTHNLHWFWDEDIIRLKKITLNDCLDLYKTDSSFEQELTGNIDYVAWLNQNRTLLDGIYDFPGFMLDQKYLDKSAIIVKRQLLLAGLRLANILNRLFYTPAPIENLDSLAVTYKNGIPINEVEKNIGKKVTICAHVFNIRSSASITQITVGDKFPNNPLTVIIFAKNYPNFSQSPEVLYKEKNICVTGKIETFREKLQIIVEEEKDIKIN